MKSPRQTDRQTDASDSITSPVLCCSTATHSQSVNVKSHLELDA